MYDTSIHLAEPLVFQSVQNSLRYSTDTVSSVSLKLDALSDLLCAHRLGCIDNDADLSVADIANQLDHVFFLLRQLYGNHDLFVIIHLFFLRLFIGFLSGSAQRLPQNIYTETSFHGRRFTYLRPLVFCSHFPADVSQVVLSAPAVPNAGAADYAAGGRGTHPQRGVAAVEQTKKQAQSSQLACIRKSVQLSRTDALLKKAASGVGRFHSKARRI